jgi:hypothetical protein
MTLAANPSAELARPALSRVPVTQLAGVCADRGVPDLAHRLIELDRWIAGELRDFDRALATVPRGVRAVQAAAHHLLDLGGKHLRPMCVALAAKCGTGFDDRARQLAIAVELVHTATLLHDDVVDVADTRRAQPSARMIYGNAASIFAGDWLLVEALRRIRGTGDLALLDGMLGIIEEMILAESLQLERRGHIDGDVADYVRVAEGKTAALFRWAMRRRARGPAAARRGGGRARVVRRRPRRRLPDRRRLPRLRRRRRGHRQGAVHRPARGQADPAAADRAAARSRAGGAGRRGDRRRRRLARGADPPPPGDRHRIAATGALAEARRRGPGGGSAARSTRWRSCPTGPARAALTTVAEATATREK